MTTVTEARNADLTDLRQLLMDQHARKVDVVAPASTIRSRGGLIHVKGADAELSEDGVTVTDGVYRPTAIFDEGVAEKLGIPTAYLRKMRETRPDMYDANVNGWLHGKKITRSNGFVESVHPGDARSFLLRAFKGDDGCEGVARAFLSDSFRVIDHFDVLVAALAGVRDAGVDAKVSGCDLSERRMSVRIVVPEIQVLAPELLAGYRSPFSGALGADNPTVFAGIEIGNSETGNGAFTVTPRFVFEICTNGMKITKDALRAVHLGGKLDEGVIKWSDETKQKSIELVSTMTRDSVATFLNVDYMREVIAGINEKAGVEVAPTEKAIRTITKKLQFDDATAAGVFDHFVRGGQFTAGGVMQAVTSYAQTVTSPDTASDLEDAGLRALEFAAAL
jgi:hypothetical protein